jgi:hypothetical protein
MSAHRCVRLRCINMQAEQPITMHRARANPAADKAQAFVPARVAAAMGGLGFELVISAGRPEWGILHPV